jgi:hypothetical protein
MESVPFPGPSDRTPSSPGTKEKPRHTGLLFVLFSISEDGTPNPEQARRAIHHRAISQALFFETGSHYAAQAGL